MVFVDGMVVILGTVSNPDWAGTDDHLYVGVVGKSGGREFALAVPDFQDFEKGSDVEYHLGNVWETSEGVDYKEPWKSHGDWNDPSYGIKIDLQDADYVYLRKAGSRSHEGDDRYCVEGMQVSLYGTDRLVRRFVLHGRISSQIILSNETGNQVWLAETKSSREWWDARKLLNGVQYHTY